MAVVNDCDVFFITKRGRCGGSAGAAPGACRFFAMVKSMVRMTRNDPAYYRLQWRMI